MKEKLSPDLLRGSLDLMILSVLADGPKYGYLIQQRLREVSRERVELQAGTLYPLLHKLEDEKLVRCRWDSETGRRRKWYELTATGQRRLKKQVDQWREYADCLRELLAPVTEARPNPA